MYPFIQYNIIYIERERVKHHNTNIFPVESHLGSPKFKGSGQIGANKAAGHQFVGQFSRQSHRHRLIEHDTEGEHLLCVVVTVFHYGLDKIQPYRCIWM